VNGRPIVPNALVVQLSCEQESDRLDRDGYPRVSPRGSTRLAHIPTKLALKAAEIHQLGLHLNHEQYARLRIEGQNVDPPRPPRSPYWDFPLDNPAFSGEATCNVRDAPRVGRVALSRARDEHWRLDPEDERCAQCFANRFSLGDRQPEDAPSFNKGQMRLRSPDSPGQLTLAQAQRHTDSAHRRSETVDSRLAHRRGCTAEALPGDNRGH